MTLPDPELHRDAVQDLEQWLRSYAEAGIPELILIQLLRDQAVDVEQRGFVSRIERPPPATSDSSGSTTR